MAAMTRAALPCAFCGIRPGNRAGIRVEIFSLVRWRNTGRGTVADRQGQIGFCERCQGERRRGAQMFTEGFRIEAKT